MKHALGLRVIKKTLILGLGTALFPVMAMAAEPPPEKKPEVDGKGRVLWLDGEAGIQTAQLSTFNHDYDRFSVGFIPRSGVGPSVGAAVGVRIVFLTLGVRGRVARFEENDRATGLTDWSMASLNGEIGMRAPLKRFEPYALISGGYTTFGGFGDAIRGVRQGLNVNGANFRLGFGFDYFLGKHISVGVMGSGEILGLTRPGIPVRDVAALPASQRLDTAARRFLESDGSTWGTALALTGGVKGHF